MFEFMSILDKLRKVNRMSKEEMVFLSNLFCEDMNVKESLKMLPAHIYMDKAIKPGEYIALDFGGSNVRIMLYKISENGESELLNSRLIRLRGKNYDYTSSEYELRDVFVTIVEKMKEMVDKDKTYLLGHTFSFPASSVSKNEAIVVGLSKGFTLRNAIGQDVNKLLLEVINEAGLNVTPVTLLNDTTATLLAGKSKNANTDIACIVGTGHNICFVDNDQQIVNTECGAFDMGIPLNSYDKSFLRMIPKEGHNVMEALVGGKNSAKLAMNLINRIEKEAGKKFKFGGITPKLLSMALDDRFEDDFAGGIEEKIILKHIAKIMYDRAAQLVVSEIMGILKRIDPNLEREHHIVFDGSVYEKTPYFRKCISKYIKLMYPVKFKQIRHSLVKDGSSLGAAISAAM